MILFHHYFVGRRSCISLILVVNEIKWLRYLTTSRHYVTRWRFKCFIKLFVSMNLAMVEYCHSSVVKGHRACELNNMSSNPPGAFVHINWIKFLIIWLILSWVFLILMNNLCLILIGFFTLLLRKFNQSCL